MKKQLLTLAMLATLGAAQAQSPTYTTTPNPLVDGTGAVTLKFDLSGTALASSAFSGDVYMYTGIDVMTPAPTSTTLTWQHVRRAWGDVANDAVYKLTPAGTDIYTYSIPNLRGFYALGADTMILTLNFVIRNTAGDKQAGDLKINVTQAPVTTGIIKVKGNDLSLTVAPNPAKDQLNVNLANATGKSNLKLVNVVGQTVITMNEIQEATTLSVADLPAGIYFLKVTTGDKQITKKIVKE